MPFDPSTLLDVSHLAAFLGGTAVGAAGTYFADLFTDQRRRKESESKEKNKFALLQERMKGFFDEIRVDLLDKPELGIREFVVLPNERITFTHDHPRFEYYESKYPGVKNYVAMLVEADYVDLVRSTGTPIYRFKEEFVSKLSR